MNMRATIKRVLSDAIDANPDEELSCPHCGAKARRAGGPFYYWQCTDCGAFGTTWDWEQAYRRNRMRARPGG